MVPPENLPAYFIFRQDQPDFQDIFAFPEERQKPISLFEGVLLAIKTEQRSDMNVWQQYHRPLWLSFPAESGMVISRFRLEIEKAIDPINPVQYKNYN
jgi:hypothetical protein